MASPERWPRDTYRELLEEMTLEAKVAQLGSVNANELLDDTGELAEETIDEAVSCVLRAKVRRGLLDDPTVDPDAATDPFGTDEARALTERRYQRRGVGCG